MHNVCLNQVLPPPQKVNDNCHILGEQDSGRLAIRYVQENCGEVGFTRTKS